jgi:hypothetical protein
LFPAQSLGPSCQLRGAAASRAPPVSPCRPPGSGQTHGGAHQSVNSADPEAPKTRKCTSCHPPPRTRHRTRAAPAVGPSERAAQTPLPRTLDRVVYLRCSRLINMSNFHRKLLHPFPSMPKSLAEASLGRTDCRVPIAECRLPSADCRVPMVDDRWPMADGRWPIADGR